jgi:hypothetical protein
MTAVQILAVANAVAAYGLPGTITELPRRPMDDDDWDVLLALVQHQSLTGFLESAVADGALQVDSDQAQQVERAHDNALDVRHLAEDRLCAAALALGNEGMEYRVIGAASASWLDYPSPGVRPFRESSLLVHPSERADAARVLQDAALIGGGVCSAVVALYTPRFLDDAAATELIWLEPDHLSLDELTLPTPPRPVRFLLAGLEAVSGGDSLASFRDLAQMHLANDLDSAATLALISAASIEAELAGAIKGCWKNLELADVTALSVWAQHHRDRVVPGVLTASRLQRAHRVRKRIRTGKV